jgi:hypothetical protein
MAKQDDFIRYTIRVPADLYRLVEMAAFEANRSNNAEIIARLEASFAHSSAGVSEADAALVQRIERLEEAVREVLAVSGAAPLREPSRLNTADVSADQAAQVSTRSWKDLFGAGIDPASPLDPLPPHIAELVDEWIARQPDPKPSREEALNIIVRGEANTNSPAVASASQKLSFHKARKKKP